MDGLQRSGGQFEHSTAGAWIPIQRTDPAHVQPGLEFQRIRLIWRGQPEMTLTIRSIALYPQPSG